MTRIIQRHDTAANWSTINPVLALGEMGVETDTNKFKFGDGTTSYNALPYAAGEGGGTGGSGTILTSIDGGVTYDKLALGEGLVVGTGVIPWTNPQMSSNSQDGYVASASISSSSSGAEIWKAFDKDITTSENAYYTGEVSLPQWIMLECPKPVRLTSCMIMNEVATPVNLRSGYIQGSNDGNTFDTLFTIVDRPNTTGYEETYTFNNNKYYKYLRVYFTEQWPGQYGNGISIQEIEFSGYIKDETAVPTLNVSIDEISTLANRISANEADIAELQIDKQDRLTAGDGIEITNEYQGSLSKDIHPYPNGTIDLGTTYPENEVVVNTQTTLFKNPTDISTSDYTIIYKVISPVAKDQSICLGTTYGTYVDANGFVFKPNSAIAISTNYNIGNGDWYISNDALRTTFVNKLNSGEITFKCTRKIDGTTVTKEIQISDDGGVNYHPASYFGYSSDAIIVTDTDNDTFFQEYTSICTGSSLTIDTSGIEMIIGDGLPVLTIQSKPATITSIGAVQPDGTTITVNNTGVISGQDVKKFTGYSDTGTLVLKSINGVLQWVAEV